MCAEVARSPLKERQARALAGQGTKSANEKTETHPDATGKLNEAPPRSGCLHWNKEFQCLPVAQKNDRLAVKGGAVAAGE
jgi:hypothetical protein